MDKKNNVLAIAFDKSGDRLILEYLKTDNFDDFIKNLNVKGAKRKEVKEKHLVREINKIIKSNIDDNEDVLILNKNGKINFGRVLEMQTLLHENDHHGFISPRISKYEGDEAKKYLHRYDLVPYPDANFVLVRGRNFLNVGYFDERYGDFGSALCDIALKWGRYGYSSLIDNHVYFNARKILFKKRDNLMLAKNNDEYSLSKRNYAKVSMDPMVYFDEILKNSSEKKKILFYFIPVQGIYNGTSEYALALLNSFVKLFGDKYDISVLISQKTYNFFINDIPKSVDVLFEENIDKIGKFDLVFSPVQHFSESNLPKILSLAPRNALMIHDVIALRCPYLSQFGPAINLNALAIELSDGFISNSQTSLSDIKDYFNLKDRGDLYSSFTHLAVDYNFKTNQNKRRKNINLDFLNEKYIFIIGNSFKHKSTREAVNLLKKLPIKKVVMGGSRFEYNVNESDDFIFLPSGSIPEDVIDETYKRAQLYVYPSQYEGFGFPVLKALKYCKKIVLFNSKINRELFNLYVKNKDQVFFFEKFSQLTDIVNANLNNYTLPETSIPTWDDVAKKTEQFMIKILERPINPQSIRLRWYIAKLWQNKEIAEYEISIGMLKNLSYRYFRRKFRRYFKTAKSYIFGEK
ncbi:MAG: glycosyltransferase [Candidatus Moraniibacteriota bacterium]